MFEIALAVTLWLCLAFGITHGLDPKLVKSYNEQTQKSDDAFHEKQTALRHNRIPNANDLKE